MGNKMFRINSVVFLPRHIQSELCFCSSGLTKTFFLLATFYLLISCAGGSKSGNSDTIDGGDNQPPLYVFLENILEKENSEPLSSVASEIIYIPLETNDNSLLREVEHISYVDGNYVIRDTYNIYLFNHEGKFIKQVARQGGGPSDYISVPYRTIVDRETNNFYLFTRTKVLKFDKNANFLYNFQIDDAYSTIGKGVFTANKTMVLGLSNQVWALDDTTTVYNAIEIDTIGNVINKYINNSPRRMDNRQSYGSVISIYTFNNKIRFLDYGSDTLFSVVNGSMIPYAILDLGNNKTDLTPDIPKFDNIRDIHEFMINLKGHKIQFLIEDESFLFISLTEKGHNSNNQIYCIFNKKTKELKLLKEGRLLNDLDGGIHFFPKTPLIDNMLISWKSAEEFKEEILSKDYNTQKAKYGERFEKVYQLAKSLDDDDNDILIIAKK